MGEITAYEPGTPAWIDLATADAEPARAFYTALLGWDFDIGGPEMGGYTYCLSQGRRVAGMIPAHLSPAVWTTYLASKDVDATAERLAAAGGTVTVGPADAGPAGRVVVGLDTTGAPVGAWQAGEHLGAELVNEVGAVVWNELHTRDLVAAMAFYSDVFGHTWDDVDTGAGGPDYRTFSASGNLAGGALQIPEGAADDAPTGWVPYFGVADADAAADSVERHGGRCLQPPMDSPYGRLAILQDPQGATFAVITAETPSG